MPWEWDLLTVEQEDHLLAWLDSYEKSQREANERMERGR